MTTDNKTIAEHKKHDNNFELSYRLDVSELEFEGTVYPSYSIYTAIASTDKAYSDETVIRNVTTNKDVATALFDLICKGSVTPLTLADVAEDYIAEL